MNDHVVSSGSTLNPMAFVVVLLIMLALYVYMSYSLMVIAKKTNTQPAWLAWVPIASIFLMLMVAKKSLWWFILFFIPLANVVFAVIVWMKISEAVGKPDWIGILMIVPIVNIFVPGYLAFSNSPAMPTQIPPSAPVGGM